MLIDILKVKSDTIEIKLLKFDKNRRDSYEDDEVKTPPTNTPQKKNHEKATSEDL